LLSCSVVVESQMPRFEPRVDSLGDGSRSRLEHHVVTHVREDLCIGTVHRSGGTNFARGDDGVVLGSQYQHWDAVPSLSIND
jgi:hypothetical protein